MYLKIESKGEIDLNSLILMGASSKRNDSSKIGYFGSGLKYSIAYLLKNNYEFYIYSGLNKINISTKKEMFRETEVNKIIINNLESSLTTDMGGDKWKLWYIIRELYSNAIDEGEENICIVSNIVPEKNKTIFYIKTNEEIKNITDNWNKYFSFKRDDLIINMPSLAGLEGYNRVYKGSEQLILYRKGIRCSNEDESEKSLFHYDFCDFKINESRVIESYYDTNIKIGKYLAQYSNKYMIKTILSNYSNSFLLENRLYWNSVIFNSLWREVIGNRKIVSYNVSGYFKSEIESGKAIIISDNLLKALSSSFEDLEVLSFMTGEKSEYLIIDTTKKQKDYIDKALIFLYNGGFEIKQKIAVGMFKDINVMGQAENNTIILSDKVFERGLKYLIETILEECFHLESEYKDETRGFQDFLIRKLVTMIEDKTGVYL